jgi:hypothetical protein
MKKKDKAKFSTVQFWQPAKNAWPAPYIYMSPGSQKNRALKEEKNQGTSREGEG